MINAQQKSIALALVIIFGGIILSFFANPFYAWGMLLAIMIGMGLFGAPERMLVAYVVWSLIGPLAQLVLGGPFAYIDESLCLGCIMVLVGIRSMKRPLAFSHKGYIVLFFALILVGVISTFASKAPLLPFVNGMLTYYSFPFVLLIAYECRSEKTMKYVWNLAAGFIVVQVLLNLGWIAGVNPLPNKHAMVGNYSDVCHGTLLSAQWVAYMMIWLIFLFISFGRYALSRQRKRIAYLLASIAFVQFQFTFTNHAYLYLILCAGIYLVVIARSANDFLKKLVFISLFASIAITVGILAQRSIYDKNQSSAVQVSSVFSKQNLTARYDRFVRAPKMQLINKVTLRWARTEPFQWLIGLGVGNGTSAIGMTRVSPGAFELLAEHYLTQTGREQRAGSSIMESTYSGLVSLWSEIGALGYLIYQGMCFLVAFRVWKNLRRKRYTSIPQKILAESFIPAMLMYFISSFLTDAYYLDAWTVTLWAWAGLVFTPIRVDDEKPDDAKEEMPVDRRIPLSR